MKEWNISIPTIYGVLEEDWPEDKKKAHIIDSVLNLIEKNWDEWVSQ